MKKLLLFFSIWLVVFPLFAEIKKDNLKKNSFLIVPNFSYSDETNFVTGLVSVATRETPIGKTNAYALIFQYSLKNQIGLTFSTNIYSPKVKYDITLQVEKWPSEFYGVGIDSKEKVKEKFTPMSFDFTPEFAFNLNSKMYFSLIPAIKKFKIDKFESNGILSQHKLSGTDEPFTCGLGLGFLIDDKDDQFYPKAGYEFLLRYIEFSYLFGSEKNYNQFRIEYNRYITLSKPLIFALQLMAEFNTGDTPFQEMAQLGKNIRGYDSMRFIDKNMQISRFELRYKPFSGAFSKRIGFIGFLDVGTVFSNYKDVVWDDYKVTYGIGFRFQFSKNSSMNIRADYGMNNETSGMNIAGNEAF